MFAKCANALLTLTISPVPTNRKSESHFDMLILTKCLCSAAGSLPQFPVAYTCTLKRIAYVSCPAWSFANAFGENMAIKDGSGKKKGGKSSQRTLFTLRQPCKHFVTLRTYALHNKTLYIVFRNAHSVPPLLCLGFISNRLLFSCFLHTAV